MNNKQSVIPLSLYKDVGTGYTKKQLESFKSTAKITAILGTKIDPKKQKGLFDESTTNEETK